MRLRTVAIWGGISLVAILAVGYADPEWMFRTAVVLAGSVGSFLCAGK